MTELDPDANTRPLFARILTAFRQEWKPIFTLTFFFVLFFYKFFFFGFLYNGSDILNHWFFPWSARQELRPEMPKNPTFRKLALLGEKLNVGPILSRPSNPEISDPVFTYNPSIEYCVKKLKSGEMPLWNPSLICGYNQIGDGTYSPFYPLNAIYFIPKITPLLATTIKILLSVYLLGLFSYFLFRNMNCSPFSSTAAAMVMMFSASTISFLEYISFLDAYIWMPLLFLIYRLYMRERNGLYLVFSSLVLGAVVLSQNPKPISYVCAFFALYILVHVFILKEWNYSIWKKALYSAYFSVFTFCVGIALGAVATLPMIKAVELTERSHSQQMAIFLHFGQLIESITSSFSKFDLGWSVSRVFYYVNTLFFPKLYGFASDGKLWSPFSYVENGSYVGVFVLALAGWCVFRKKSREELFWLLSGLFAFAVACLIPPFYSIFCFLVPTNGLPRTLFVFTFCFACLMAFMLDKLTQDNNKDNPKKVRVYELWLPILLFVISGVVATLIYFTPDYLYQLCLDTKYLGIESSREIVIAAGGEAPAAVFSREEFNAYHFRNFICIAAFSMLTIIFLYWPKILRHTWLVFALIFAQLAYYGINYNPTVLESDAYAPTDTTQFLKENCAGYRIAPCYTPGNILPAGTGAWLGYDDATKKTCSIIPKRIMDVYIQFDPGSRNHYITGIKPFSNYKLLNRGLIDLLAIKYLVSPVSIEEIDDESEYRAVGLKIERDFVKSLQNAAVSQPLPNYVAATSCVIINNVYRAILANPHSEITYKLNVPKRAKLSFGIAMNPACWGIAQGDGVNFSIRVDSGTESTVVFNKSIDPKNNIKDQKVFSEMIDLGAYAGKDVSLTFITDGLKDGGSDWALWVRPVITTALEETDTATPVKFRRVWSKESCFIYENLHVLPRAFLSFGAKNVRSGDLAAADENTIDAKILQELLSDDFNPRKYILLNGAKELNNSNNRLPKAVTFREITNSRYEYQTDADQESYLYLADTYDAGWRATVDGKEVPIERANYTFRAIYLPPGKHHVELAYSPAGFRQGCYISSAFVVFLLVYNGVVLWQRRRRQTVTAGSLRCTNTQK